MTSFGQMIDQSYRYGAPTQEIEEMDARAITGVKCRGCGGPMYYEGYFRDGPGYGEYVALAVCNRCGHEEAVQMEPTALFAEICAVVPRSSRSCRRDAIPTMPRQAFAL